MVEARNNPYLQWHSYALRNFVLKERESGNITLYSY